MYLLSFIDSVDAEQFSTILKNCKAYLKELHDVV
jgi:hypothetical protein